MHRLFCTFSLSSFRCFQRSYLEYYDIIYDNHVTNHRKINLTKSSEMQHFLPMVSCRVPVLHKYFNLTFFKYVIYWLAS